MAFGTHLQHSLALRRGGGRSGPPNSLCCLAAGRVRSSITTPRSSSPVWRGCTSEGGRRGPKECCPGSMSPPMGPRGACRGPMARSRAAQLAMGRLGNQQEKPAVDLRVAAASAPPAYLQGHPPLQAARRRAGRAGIQPSPLEGSPPSSSTLAEGSGNPACRLHFFEWKTAATANKMVRRGISPPFPAPSLCHPCPTVTQRFDSLGDTSGQSNLSLLRNDA